eukprot:2259565-Rhodomonas_salina.1
MSVLVVEAEGVSLRSQMHVREADSEAEDSTQNRKGQDAGEDQGGAEGCGGTQAEEEGATGREEHCTSRAAITGSVSASRSNPQGVWRLLTGT